MRMIRHAPDCTDKRTLVPLTWIEHVASPLPRECSTTELQGRYCKPPVHHTTSKQIPGAGEGNRTLVLSLEGFSSTIELHPQSKLLNYIHSYFTYSAPTSFTTYSSGGESWIRTNVGVSQQIYSLPPLAARASLREPYIFSCSVNAVNLQVLLPQVKTPRP